MRPKGIYRNIHQDLIDLCKSGDSQAQFQIYSLYHKAMYNTCLRIVGVDTDAEDIMQESFLKAFQKLHTYSNEVSFGAWLKRIVVNASIDSLKKRKHLLVPIDEVHGITSNEDFDSHISSIDAQQVRTAIDRLPQGFRIIVSLVLVEGYSHDEVAKMLGITPSTSRSQLARARQRLALDLKALFAL